MNNTCTCGNKLQWDYANIASGVVQGRLNSNEVNTVFFSSCEACGEEGKTISMDDVLEVLNKQDK